MKNGTTSKDIPLKVLIAVFVTRDKNEIEIEMLFFRLKNTQQL
jgi:hypothetical protein